MYALPIAVTAVALMAAGCTVPNPEYCDSDTPCELTGRTYCDLAGQFGPANTCIADPGVAHDAAPATADASRDAKAGAPDAASSDAAPLAPPVSNGQAADLVLGQPDFESAEPNNGGESAASLNLPSDVTSDGARLWIADAANARVLQWNALPLFDMTAANIVIGQNSTMSHTSGISQQRLGGGALGPETRFTAFSDGNVVVTGNRWTHRAMLWDSVPTVTFTAADVVLGQPDFTSSDIVNPPTSSSLQGASGAWSDGTRLVVADANDNRVLIWSTMPTTINQEADLVLGQPNFTSDSAPGTPSLATMNGPEDVFFDGQRLYVADTFNNRILVWNSFPTTNGQPADFVIGQSSGTTGNANAGAPQPNSVGLELPRGVRAAHGSLFISDHGNNRVVVHTPVPMTSGEQADAVLGQTDFTSRAPGTTATTLQGPRGIAIAGNYLFVADTLNHRSLRYTLTP